MRTLLLYVFALLLVGGLLFLAASFAFGRDEEMAPALPEGTPVVLPDDRPATGADLHALRLAVVLRGYRMEEVDWVLDRLAEQVDARDREIARLRSVLHVEPMGRSGAGSGEDGERLTAPGPRGPTQPPADPPRAAGDAPGPARAGAVPGPVPVPGDWSAGASADRPGSPRDRSGPGADPVRGLRPDAAPDRDPR